MLIRFVFRSLKKHFFLSLIKVMGLSLAFSGILFIVLFLNHEFSFDKFHKKANQIYRFTMTSPRLIASGHFARFHMSEQIPDLANRFPEIENYVRLAPIRGGVVKVNNMFYNINQAFVSDSTFFDIFDAEILAGNKETALKAPGSVVVSESFARKIFGVNSPVGQVITRPAGFYYEMQTDFTVTAVMKDFPQNSHFHPELLATVHEPINWWAWCYLQLSENANPQNITSAYPAWLSEISNQPVDSLNATAYLQQISDIHLHSDKLREIETNGNPSYLYVLAFAGLILLLISMSNYASLNLGMADFNYKFIAVSRLMGAPIRSNLTYLAAESLVIIGITLILTFFVSNLAHEFILSHYNINLFAYEATVVFVTLTILSLLAMIAGIVPTWKRGFAKINTKSFKPLKTKNMAAGKSIIVFQYALSIILIISVLVISRQTQFALNKSLGAHNDSIVCFEYVHSSVQGKFETFKAELLKYNTIETVSAMLEPPGGEANDMFQFEMEDYHPDESEQTPNMIGVFPCDYSFPKIFNLEFLGGEDFSEKNADSDVGGEYIINETAMNYLNHTQPNDIIGKRFRLIASGNVSIPEGKIIGVVKDFHLSSLKKKVQPLVLFKRENMWMLNFVVGFRPGMQHQAVADIEKVWKQLFPDYPFEYKFVDSMNKAVYKTEMLQAKLLLLFTLISLFICSMGLLGLSLIIAQKRTKEIAIRKVNGAKISEILYMLNMDILKWVVVAFVIAVPAGYFAMARWLENFAYKTELSWWIFALAGLIALLISMATISWQSLKSARKNPVESLRYE